MLILTPAQYYKNKKLPNVLHPALISFPKYSNKHPRFHGIPIKMAASSHRLISHHFQGRCPKLRKARCWWSQRSSGARKQVGARSPFFCINHCILNIKDTSKGCDTIASRYIYSDVLKIVL